MRAARKAIMKAVQARRGNFSAGRFLSTTRYCSSPQSCMVGRYMASVSKDAPKLRFGESGPVAHTLTRRALSCTRTCNAIAREVTKEHGHLIGPKSSQVPISIDGEMVDFSAILLRDLCPCPLCVHESTRQRLFSAADIPVDIQAQEIKLNATSDSVSIKWQKDVAGYTAEHVTTLDLEALRNLDRSGSPSGFRKEYVPAQVLWTREPLHLPDYDYDTYMKDDRALYSVIKQLRTHGLAFVKNIPSRTESLETIATRIGPIKDTFYGYTWDVRTVPKASNAAYTSHDLGFHTDLLYFTQPPHIQLLHCMQSASSGGSSVFADAYRAAVDLFDMDPDAFETLATVPVNYHYNHPDSNVYRTTKPVIDLRPLRLGDTVYTRPRDYITDRKALYAENDESESTQAILVDCMDKINWGPPFLAPFSVHEHAMEQEKHSGQPTLSVLNSKVDEWHRASAKFNVLLQRPEYLYERRMKPGECVLFDNTRTLHSRRAFDMADVGKPRWLRGTYVDKDPYYSKLRVLQNKFG